MTEKQHKDSLAAPDNNCCIALVSQHRAVKEIRAFVALRRRDTPYWEFVDYIPDPDPAKSAKGQLPR